MLATSCCMRMCIKCNNRNKRKTKSVEITAIDITRGNVRENQA